MNLHINWILIPIWCLAVGRFWNVSSFAELRQSIGQYLRGSMMGEHYRRMKDRLAKGRVMGGPGFPDNSSEVVNFLWDLALASLAVSAYYICKNVISGLTVGQVVDQFNSDFAKEGLKIFDKQQSIESLKTKPSVISVVSPSASNVVPSTTGAEASQPVSPKIVKTYKTPYWAWGVCIVIALIVGGGVGVVVTSNFF